MSNNKLKEVLKFGNSFCILPFIHEFIDINSTRRVCCHSHSHDMITEERLKQIRSEMLQNKPIPECSKCVSCESHKVFSERQLNTRHWEKRYPNLINQSITNPYTYSYDLRYSNLCNLRCQTCGPYASSAWAKFLNQEDVYKSWDPDTIEINADAKRIYLAGGEPFMIKSFSHAINNLENKDCEIVINTNATIITNHMLEALKPFNDVCFVLSIDGTGETIEKIRTGCNWETINANIEMLKQKLNCSFMINTVVQKDNIDNIPELAKWIDQKEISIWHTTILKTPIEYEYKNYKGKISWDDTLWNANCVVKNIQVKNSLSAVYANLCA